MSNLPEIKKRLDRLTQLASGLRERLSGPGGPAGEEMKKKFKEAGTRIGVGSGISFFGLIVASVASVYILAVIILLVNIALDLWLSALIVVGCFLLLGLLVIAIGIGIAQPAAKELSKASGEVTGQLKEAGEEMKKEVEELQKVTKLEAGERQKQMADMIGKAKKAAPAAAGAYMVFRLMKRAVKSRREKRAILKVIEAYEETKTRE